VRRACGLLLGLALALASSRAGTAPAPAEAAEAGRLDRAKTLLFDRKYVEARAAWREILAAAKGPDAELAAYWIARCSESLGEDAQAFREFGEFLKRRPADATLAEEARTHRVGLAARLYKAGNRQQAGTLREALQDSSRTLRYYAALQLAGLGPDVGRPAIPVLREILAREADADLVDRAKLALIRLDPDALAAPAARETARREARWLRLRVFKAGQSKPQVSVNVPVALAEIVFKSLPDEARAELRRKGYDAETFWDKLRRLGPTQVLDIQGEDGGRVQVWLE